jgi:two-component system sensor histidine kinase UhpB
VTSTDTEIGELAQAFNSMLDRLEQARREQAMLILQAQEEERRRLALELHDESSQNLSAVLIHTEILSQSLRAFPEPMSTQPMYEQLREGLQLLNRLTQKTLDNIRTLAQQLRPGVLDDLGLASALRWLAEDSRERLHLPVEVQLEQGEEIIHTQKHAARYETALFRIAQESLTNAARHAHAQRVWLSLMQDQQSISLQVRDDGCGFDPLQKQVGLGIAGMRERATLLEGTLTIISQPGQGTTVKVCLPLSTSCLEEAVHA